MDATSWCADLDVNLDRLPRDSGDPACAMPRFDAYLRLLAEMNEEDSQDMSIVFSSENAM